ncbi:lysylphosphatidylglycerol synthase domain-containing protein [Pararobbsia silviterrae]|uniref:TIGR00374 family protein n=1 Tax=Pararobbsia silviterrae TaxID=1792498 RepID=A0A494XDL4_9BURK|nr:lysylphosphatidylglycerol synthase domain-containing protein [Pararobbsia silviterrae]RKP46556.1 TIGR00374 family protein [Pararobbsia silviterrae]
MTRAALVSLSIGLALFIGLLVWQGAGPLVSALSLAGFGVIAVAVFHLVPLVLDAGAIHVLAPRGLSLSNAILARWSGESVNSLLPAGQIGGPVLMVRRLAQLGASTVESASVITVSTTLQTGAQVVFSLIGLVVLGAHAVSHASDVLWIAGAAVTAVLAAMIYGFYHAQRRGLFGWLSRRVAKFGAGRDWSTLLNGADAVDARVHAIYRERAQVVASFALSLVGWIVGTAEVWMALRLIGHPVGWSDALMLESLGQAIRGAAFAIPGALGVQEGGYLLLAPLVGLPPDAALALSLIKRARELILGIPGLVFLHFSERGSRRGAARLQTTD